MAEREIGMIYGLWRVIEKKGPRYLVECVCGKRFIRKSYMIHSLSRCNKCFHNTPTFKGTIINGKEQIQEE